MQNTNKYLTRSVSYLLVLGFLLCFSTVVQASGRPVSCPPNIPWCGCWLADYFHILEPKRFRRLWVARNWVYEGSPAAKGCIGCVAVLRRGKGGHVGVVVDWQGNDPVIKSGNHNNAVGVGRYSAGLLLALRQL